MKTNKKIILLIISTMIFSNRNYAALAENILLIHSNSPVQFDKVNETVINDAVKIILTESDVRIKKITDVAKGTQTIENTLLAFDEMQYELSDLQCKLGTIQETYVDDKTRHVAEESNDKLSLYSSNIILNENLYNALKKFSASGDAKNMNTQQKKYLSDLLTTFEKNGMKISAEARKSLEAINKRIIDLGSNFNKNIAESKDSLEFTEEELKGIPSTDIAEWKSIGGKYFVYVNGPNNIKISQYANNSNTRRLMYIHYNNRAYPQNIQVLDSLFYYRNKLAEQLGYKSYADYALVDKMAKTPAAVWSFENDLKSKLAPLVTSDLAQLKQMKKQLNSGENDSLYAWDIAYYTKKLLDSKYQLNTDEVKEYFELNNTINGMFLVYQKLLGIEMKETHDVPVWYAKVRSFEMFKEGKKIGTFYFDLFPRQNKYTHFECSPLCQYRKVNGIEYLPVSALICNFPEGTSSAPSLLNHSDVIILFHEFGHLVHSMLGRSDLAGQGPFNVKGDFVEAPSQFLENWCWEYASLSLFAKNYKTGAVLPKTLFDKMKSAQLVNSGIANMRQVSLGMTDFTYEDHYAQTKAEGISKISKNIFAINQLPYPEGSNYICSFGHLNGYGANYYGYLWSKVFAQDMFSVFQKNGVMDTETGVRYRKTILENAATKEEMDLLREFLGREPNSEAFLKSLGIN